jgi:hypothetical protein
MYSYQFDSDKIDLIDKLFGALDIQQLKDIAESELIVAKLKGTEYNPRLVRSLIDECVRLGTDLDSAKNEINALRSDIQTLVRVLNKPYDYQAQQDMNNLKSRFGIY